MNQLPAARQLFDRYFLTEYGPRDKARLPVNYPRQEIVGSEDFLGKTGSDVSQITTESQQDVAEIIQTLLDHAELTWGQAYAEPDVFTLKGLAAFDRGTPADSLAALIKNSDPLNPNNDYLIRCSLLGAVIGETIRQLVPNGQWVYDHPIWESGILAPDAGAVVPVFHWAVHRLSADGAHEETAAKVLTAVDMIGRISKGTAAAREKAGQPQPTQKPRH
jgi:hypothetical protein